jgi:hypothetical protein
MTPVLANLVTNFNRQAFVISPAKSLTKKHKKMAGLK